jgi:hypothetical protein
MLELLLTKIDANQEKAEADRKAAHEDLIAKMEADRAQMEEFMKTLQAYQAKTDAVLPAIQVTETSRKETAAVIKPETEELETMACQGREARPEEEKPTSADRKPEAAEEYEVPAENATVMPVEIPKKKQRRDRKLAAEHRRQKSNTSTRDNCGTQKRLDVARTGSSRRGRVTRHAKETDRKMSRRATVARRRRDIVRKNLAHGTGGFPRKGLVMADKKITRCASMAEHNRVRPQGDHLESRTSPHKDVSKRTREKRELRETIRKLRKQFETYANAQAGVLRGIATNKNVKNWTLWRGRPPPKRKKRNGPYGRNRW